MLNKFGKWLETAILRQFGKLISQLDFFDPATLCDPVALKTGWTPLKPGGTNLGTHKLVQRHGSRMEFRVSVSGLLFALVFLCVGVGVLVACATALVEQGIVEYPLLLCGLIFTGLGLYLLISWTQPIVFDQTKGWFWKGKQPTGQFGRSKRENNQGNNQAVELSQIHALQIIAEYCRGNKTSFYSYELNLVLHTGDRINVVDHGNHHRIRKDAETLANFLGVPVWDVSGR